MSDEQGEDKAQNDEIPQDSAPEEDASTAPPETPGEEEEAQPEIPLPFDIGIDPQEMMRDPFGAFSKLMANPDAMQALQGFMSSPMARNLLGGGLNSPLLQQVMANNPMLQSLLDQAGDRAGGIGNIDNIMKQMGTGGGFPFPGGFPPGANPFAGPAAPTQQPAPEASSDEDDAEEDSESLDEPILALLSPPHTGTPAYPDPAPHATLEDLLSDADPAFVSAIAELAEARLKHHLGTLTYEELTERAIAAGRHRASDLLLCQGAFAGEVAWYAICRLEEDFENKSFVPLARHALACVTYHSGYRVPSFINQLLAFLLEMDCCEVQDLRHTIWALSGQPGDAVEGIFEITWSDVADLLVLLANTDFEARLLAALAIALISWKELDPDQRPSSASKLLSSLGDGERRAAIYQHVAELLGGAEIEGVKAFHLPLTVTCDLGENFAHAVGITHALRFATEHWSLEKSEKGPREAHDGLLAALDVLWSDAEADVRAAYLDALIGSSHEALRARAYEVGAAWSPHEYLERAAEDPDLGIQRWAKKELEALR